jgi:hypothetical protein
VQRGVLLGKQSKMRAHFLNHLDTIFVGHLEVQYYQRQRMHDLGVVSVLNCRFEHGFANIDRLLPVDAVAHIRDTQLFKVFFQHQ